MPDQLRDNKLSTLNSALWQKNRLASVYSDTQQHLINAHVSIVSVVADLLLKRGGVKPSITHGIKTTVTLNLCALLRRNRYLDSAPGAKQLTRIIINKY